MRILITNDDGINAPGPRVLQAIATEIAGPRRRGLDRRPRLRAIGRRPLHQLHAPHDDRQARRPPLRRRRQPRRLRAGRHLRRAEGPAAPTSSSPASTAATTRPRTCCIPAPSAARWRPRSKACPPSRCRSSMAPRTWRSTTRSRPRRPTARQVIRDLLAKGIWDSGGYRVFYNVNFPPVPASDVKGLEGRAQGFRKDTVFGVEPHISPSGPPLLLDQGRPAAPPEPSRHRRRREPRRLDLRHAAARRPRPPTTCSTDLRERLR